jgi:hypothetical protein
MNNYLESFLRLMKGENPGGIVWTADITYWIDGQGDRGGSQKLWKTEKGYLELCRELKIMPYYWYDQFWLGEPEYDDKISVTTSGDGSTSVRTWETPVGSISEIQMATCESYSSAHTKFAVNNKSDLDVFRFILEHRRMRPACISEYSFRMEAWKEYGGLPSIALPRSPLSAFFYEWAGVQNGVFLLMDYPEILREIFGLMDLQEEPVLEAVCGLAPPLVHFADNLSSDVSAGLYEEFMAEGYKKRLDSLHASGTACVVHLDGVVRGLLPKLAAAGFDAVEALTPKPGGDLEIEEIRTVAGSDSIILWGGIPGIMFAPPFTWNDMEKHVLKTLESWKGQRFILGVADQVPPDGDIGFCPRIAEIVDRYS